MKLTTSKQSKIKSLALELAKDLKSPSDLSQLTADLTKITIEAAVMSNIECNFISRSPLTALCSFIKVA